MICLTQPHREVNLDIQSIDRLPSIPSDDQYFRELMATLRADRELDDDNPAYKVNWQDYDFAF